jgi:CubicO group peptidase (beta-lactamase class C family)
MPYYYSGGIQIPYGHRGSPTYPAGQLRSSAIQFSRFLRAYIQKGQYNGIRILDSTTVDLMTAVQDSAIEPNQGLIWRIMQLNIPNVGTRTICAHGGSSHGARTSMLYTLETQENVGMIVLTNGESDNGTVEIGLEIFAYGILHTLSNIEEKNSSPIEYTLKQNYPNPFNPITTIEFSILKTEYVTLKIYNLLGQEVATLVSDKLTPGNYIYTWDASGFASGVYYYKLETAGGFKETKKLILLK